MRRSATLVEQRWRRVLTVAAVSAMVIATPTEVALAVSGQGVAFSAGYRTSVDNGTHAVATLQLPRADSCELGDGSVTVAAFVLDGPTKTGAEFTSTCDAGSAVYSGAVLADGSPEPLGYQMRAGDQITVSIEDSRYDTVVYVTSTRGWGEGRGLDPIDLDGADFTVSATGELVSAASAGRLSAQRFRFVRVDGHRLGKTDPDAFDDPCSAVSELRHGLAFNTSFVC